MRRYSSGGKSSRTFRVGRGDDVGGGVVSSVLWDLVVRTSLRLRQKERNISSCGRGRRGLSFRDEAWAKVLDYYQPSMS